LDQALVECERGLVAKERDAATLTQLKELNDKIKEAIKTRAEATEAYKKDKELNSKTITPTTTTTTATTSEKKAHDGDDHEGDTTDGKTELKKKSSSSRSKKATSSDDSKEVKGDDKATPELTPAQWARMTKHEAMEERRRAQVNHLFISFYLKSMTHSPNVLPLL
jgi:archaellum component FlaD/FlaE